jgi:hypothetical protein
VDAPPILKTGEHILDAMALPIEGAIVGDGCPAIDLRRYACGDAAFGEGCAEPVGVISLSASMVVAGGRASTNMAAPL